MDLIRCKKAAEIIGVDRSCLGGLERKGILVPIRDWAGHRRYRKEEVESVRERLLAGKLADQNPAPAQGEATR